MALLRRRRAPSAPGTKGPAALDFDGLPRLPGGRRFWSELADVVRDKVCEGIEVPASHEIHTTMHVHAATTFLKQQLKVAVADAIADLQSEVAKLRAKRRRVSAVRGRPARGDVSGAFEIFQLPSRKASFAAVRSRYREVMRAVHPDQNPGIDPAIAQQYTEAYRVLKRHFGA